MTLQRWIASIALLSTVPLAAAGLATWRVDALERDASGPPPAEPLEVVAAAAARSHPSHERVSAVGTVLAARSVQLRNEVPGTVRSVHLAPGHIVDAGTVLVRLDVSVEEAELAVLETQAALAESLLERSLLASGRQALAEAEVDRARAERDVARAQIARLEALIERKTLRAPFRARIGLADLHPGQYLDAGADVTTLQGVDPTTHVDFVVTQRVAAHLAPGATVAVWIDGAGEPATASIVAVDARIDATTRTARVRAALPSAAGLAPGASVRVEARIGAPVPAVAVPASSLRRGPEGDHVFVLVEDAAGLLRAHRRSVTAGLDEGAEALLLAGVAPGELVASSGSFKLREGVLVVLAPTDPASSPAASPADPAATPSLG